MHDLCAGFKKNAAACVSVSLVLNKNHHWYDIYLESVDEHDKSMPICVGRVQLFIYL